MLKFGCFWTKFDPFKKSKSYVSQSYKLPLFHYNDEIFQEKSCEWKFLARSDYLMKTFHWKISKFWISVLFSCKLSWITDKAGVPRDLEGSYSDTSTEKRQPKLLSNYRPVSCLPVVLKLLKHLITILLYLY